METQEVLCKHRSIRKFQNKPIPQDTLDSLLEAGIRASNTGNMQIYSIIVSQNSEHKKELCKLHFGQKCVEDAAAVITVCVDLNRFHKWCEVSDAEKSYDNFLWFYTGSIDAAILTQNICIAAENQGLGICYLGTVTYMAKPIAEFLNLPKGVVPVTTIAIGYPDEQPELTPRLPLEAVIHYEKYNDYTSESIRKHYAPFENLPKIKAIVKENEMQNLANVFTQKRYVKKDSLAISKSFLEFLYKQEFMNNN